MSREFVWDRSQRTVVASLVLALSIALGVMCWMRPTTVIDPQPIAGSRSSELPGRLDPNVASAGDLSAIPNLGEKRAAAIVAFREMFVKRHRGEVAFQTAQDLTRVSGIGVATASNMEPFLVFPSKAQARR